MAGIEEVCLYLAIAFTVVSVASAGIYVGFIDESQNIPSQDSLGTNSVSLSLSYEVVSETNVKAQVLETFNLCPIFKDVTVNITNFGEDDALGVSIININDGLVVDDCISCKKEKLAKDTSMTSKIRGCIRPSATNAGLILSGMNFDMMEIKIK